MIPFPAPVSASARLRAQHEHTHAELVAHPAPERCDCPGHDLFYALAAVAAAEAHELLDAGETCQPCGYREPRAEPVPGQLPLGGLLRPWGAPLEAPGPWDELAANAWADAEQRAAAELPRWGDLGADADR